MLLINNVLIEKEVFSKNFVCQLDKCKGLCCVHGDYGAPVTEAEIETLDRIQDQLKPILSARSTDFLEKNPSHVYYKGLNKQGTPLHKDGMCVYAIKDEKDIVVCGIEVAYNKGLVDWKKPVSCHLYPIRIDEDHLTGLEKMTYDQWEICNPACAYGDEHQVPVYKFLEEAIKRKYGADFYDQLEDAGKKGQY